MVTVSNAPPPLPAKAIEVTTDSRPANPSQSTAISPELVESRRDLGIEEGKKPSLFARLNPFRGRKTPETNDIPRAVVLNPPAESAASSIGKAEFLRYTYLLPAPPRAGNRADAERAMSRALKAQRAGNTNEAWLDYQLATSTDPSFFDAQYNAALFALNAGDLNRALAGSEMALAIQPDSINARYNFALALKQADYPFDAVAELQRILEAKPKEARAHLTLGNLYAQQLNEPRNARAHYLKVLELDPRNSQAAAIRFWLAANP
jgi:tetratricopeptide (TPR) repeat protein